MIGTGFPMVDLDDRPPGVARIGGLATWLDARTNRGLTLDAALTTTVAALGDPVGGWVDQSGSGAHAVQLTGLKRPVWTANRINGAPALSFNGAGMCLQIPSIDLPTEFTLLAVVREASATNTFFVEHGPNATANDGFFLYGRGQGPAGIRRGTFSGAAVNADWVGATACVVGLDYAPGRLRYTKNGLSSGQVTVTATSANVAAALNIGARNQASLYFNGDLGELAVWRRALSDPELAYAVASLRARWGI